MHNPKRISIALSVAALLVVGFHTFRDIGSDGDQTGQPVGSAAETQVEHSTPEERQLADPETLADSEPEVADAGSEVNSHVNWMDRFRESADYWELANDAATLAASGDARAQYILARTLGHCNTEVELYRRLYPDPTLTPEQLIEAATAKPVNRSVPMQVLERGRREFVKCAAFFSGYPPVLLELGLGPDANTQNYWMNRALEGNDPLAHLDQTSADLSRLRHLNEESRAAVVESIREGLSIAAASADPEAWFRIGNLLAYSGSSVPSEWPAWVLAACEIGYDCTYSNPVIGNGCIEAGNCASSDTLVLQMQRELGDISGESYARSQEILYAFEHGNGDRIINEMLDQIDVGE